MRINSPPKFPLRPWLVLSLLLSFVSGHERTETFSIRFFMANRKPGNVMWPRSYCHVCRLEFAFERQEGLSAVTDLRQGFFASKNCTASRLKARLSFLYPPVMCYLDFWSRSNELLVFLGEKSKELRIYEKQHGGTKQWTPCLKKIPAAWNCKLATANWKTWYYGISPNQSHMMARNTVKPLLSGHPLLSGRGH